MKKILTISLLLNIAGVAAGLFAISKLGGFSYIKYKLSNRGVGAVYEHRKDYFERLPNGNEEIIFLGDSITEGGEWSELFANLNVKNRGINGDGIQGVMNRIEEVVSSKPKKIFLMIGLNSLIDHRPPKIGAMHRELVQTILKKSPATTLYLQSILPINELKRKTMVENKDVIAINNSIQKTATEFGLEYIDLHSIFKDQNGRLKGDFTSDGIHLNGAAYMHWKNAIIDKVN